jgi:hypothetical protein
MGTVLNYWWLHVVYSSGCTRDRSVCPSYFNERVSNNVAVSLL